jgi:hypothetical protein
MLEDAYEAVSNIGAGTGVDRYIPQLYLTG